jgi:hypothetical protein
MIVRLAKWAFDLLFPQKKLPGAPSIQRQSSVKNRLAAPISQKNCARQKPASYF